MKKLAGLLLNSPAALALAALGLVCLVLFAIPPLHDVAWVIGLVAVAAMAGVLALLVREWTALQHRVDALRADLAEARDEVRHTVAPAPESAEVPLDPDTARARRVLALFPLDTGLVQHMRVETGYSPVSPTLLEPVRTFLEEFGHTSFDSARTHHAFMDLHRAAVAFIAWIDEETITDSGVHEIRPGDLRDDGWREFSQAREQGERLIDTFVAARRAFERTALETSVLP